jgi:hypothetical protein
MFKLPEMKNKKSRNRMMGVGLLLMCSNRIIGHFAPHTNLVEFIKGFMIGLGLVLVIAAFIKHKPKPAC